MGFRLSLLAFVALLSVIGAQSASAFDPGDHLEISAIANVRAGTVFQVTVTAVDSSGAVDANFNASVSLNAAATGGSNFTGGTQTQAALNGSATFNVTLNDAADGYTLTSSASGLTGVSNAFNVTATYLSLQPFSTVRAGAPFGVTVRALDANSNLAENFAGTVSLDASLGLGTNFATTPTATASAGVASFTGLVLRDAADGYILVASASGLVSDSTSFNVTADHLALSTVPNLVSGQTFSVTATALDANNNVAENFSGTMSLSAAATGGSNLTGGTQNVGASAGVASFNGLALKDAADGYTVSASANTGAGVITGTGNAFNVSFATLQIGVVSNVSAGALFNLTVDTRDANGNIAENFSGSVTLDAAATGGSNFNGGTRTASAVAGIATFTNLALSNAADGYTTFATASNSAGLQSAGSGSFNVTANHLSVSAVANVLAGTSFSVTALALDANNNVAENFNGSVSVDAAATGGSNFTGGTQNVGAAAGVATFSGVSLNDAANGYTISATANTGGGTLTGISNAFNVAFATLQIGAVSDMVSGQLFDATVRALDANGNVAENFSGNVTLDAAATGGSNFNGGTRNASAVTGVATFTGLALNNAADGYVLGATTSNSFGVQSAVSGYFKVTASRLGVNAVANLVSGQTFSVTAIALDANNNVAENFSGTISLDAAATGGSNLTGGTHNVGAAAGVATFNGLSLNDAADGYTLSAAANTGAGLVTAISNAFNVSFATLQIGPVGNVSAGQLFNLTVDARDANGNIAENFTGSATLDAAAAGGSNFTGGTQSASGVAGIVTFPNLTLRNAADGYAIFATAANTAGLQSALSGSFNVTATHLSVSLVANMLAGTTFSVTALALDANNVIAENFNGSVSLSAAATGGSNFSGGTQTTAAAAGVATFSGLVLNTPANGYVITATSTGGLISGASNSFDVANPVPQLAINDVAVAEGNSGTSIATFTVTRSGYTGGSSTVQFATASGSALAGSDFAAASGTLTFAPGVTSSTISITISGDLLNEPDEVFSVQLTAPSNATLLDAQGLGTIRNDDPLPSLSVSDASATEGTATVRQATVEVQLSAPSGQTVTVSFATADDTAKDGNGEPAADYTANAGTLVFNPGETTKTITIALANDSVLESDEAFFVDLGTPTNATLAKGRGVVTIVDDDDPAVLLADLRTYVQNLGLSKGRTSSLLATLRNNCSSLAAFVNEVNTQTGRDINPAVAAELLRQVRAVMFALGCTP